MQTAGRTCHGVLRAWQCDVEEHLGLVVGRAVREDVVDRETALP